MFFDAFSRSFHAFSLADSSRNHSAAFLISATDHRILIFPPDQESLHYLEFLPRPLPPLKPASNARITRRNSSSSTPRRIRARPNVPTKFTLN